MKISNIDNCENKHRAKGYCRKHYLRFYKYGANTVKRDFVAIKGTYINDAGYRMIPINGKSCREHRIIMENYLERKLLKNENVHHINGDRLDNRIENLELWNTLQPAGQRPNDKLKYAKEILQQYENLEEVEDVHYW